jgi:tryptophan synthase alpha chain
LGNRIDFIFSQRRAEGLKTLMPFVVGGRPTPDAFAGLLRAMHGSGANIVEIGIPFSDPIADGPVIAGAMHEALEAGVTPESVLAQVADARKDDSLADLGLVAMVSMSIVYRFGAHDFCRRCAESGFDGLIVPDVPLEEADQITPHAAAHGLTTTFLVAPTTPLERAKRIAERCSGFVYMLARSGITGEAGGGPSSEALDKRIALLHQSSGLPVAVGFGIASGEDVRQTVHSAGADAAIVGSALVKRLENADPGDPVNTCAAEFVSELAAGLSL